MYYTVVNALGAMLTLEIQKGKVAMRNMKWSKSHGGTAGCTMRLTGQSQYCGWNGGMEDRVRAKDVGKRELYFGDSWFTGIKAVKGIKDEFGHEYFGALKTNHSGTPKAEIEKLMEKWNPGSYLVLECEEHDMWIMGYKYSHRKKGEVVALVLLHVAIAASPEQKSHFHCSLRFSWDLGLWIFNTWEALYGKMARRTWKCSNTPCATS